MTWSEITGLLFSDSFVREAFWFVLLLGPLSAVVGVLVTVRRMSGASGALSHALVLGVGLSFFFQSRGLFLWLTPFVGALLVSLVLMLLLGWLGERLSNRVDVNYNLIWAAGLSGGLLLIKMTPGYVDLLSYLFGNLLLLQRQDLYLLLLLNGAAGLLLVFQGRTLRLISFDRDFAVSRGMKVVWQELPFYLLCCLTIVTLSTMVGQLMVLAILTIPAAAALLFARNLWQCMSLALLFVLLTALGGLCLSLLFGLPTSSLTILIMTAFYVLLLPIRKKLGAVS